MAKPKNFDVTLDVDTRAIEQDFKRIKKNIRSTVKEAGIGAAKRQVLPAAMANAPVRSGTLRSNITVKGTTAGPYLTTRMGGKKGRYMGVHEFGGKFEASGPKVRRHMRTVKGQAFLRTAVHARYRAFETDFKQGVLELFDGFEVD